jgi:hypothetical protein
MTNMIDFNALSALATAALTQHQERGDRALGMLAVANGCSFPENIAIQMLGVSLEGGGLVDSTAFAHGFDFALKIGALLVSSPLTCPDLKQLIAEQRALVKEGILTAATRQLEVTGHRLATSWASV